MLASIFMLVESSSWCTNKLRNDVCNRSTVPVFSLGRFSGLFYNLAKNFKEWISVECVHFNNNGLQMFVGNFISFSTTSLTGWMKTGFVAKNLLTDCKVVKTFWAKHFLFLFVARESLKLDLQKNGACFQVLLSCQNFFSFNFTWKAKTSFFRLLPKAKLIALNATSVSRTSVRIDKKD